MFRFLIQFVAVLLFFAAARSVISWLLRTAAASFRATGQQPQSEPRHTPDTLMSTAELYRDPVCGTFVPGTTSFTRNVDGHTLYFCSAACRERFLVSARG